MQRILPGGHCEPEWLVWFWFASSSLSLCQPSMGVRPMMMDSSQQMAMMPRARWPVTKPLYLQYD
jgi:hypothetical protein